MIIVFYILAIVPILATGIAILRRKVWWIRIFDFPRLQIIFLQVVSIIGILFLADYENWLPIVMLSLSFIALAIQIVYIFPYSPFAAKMVPDNRPGNDRSISFMVSNVLQSNRNSGKLIAVVRKFQPDVLLTVETDSWWEKALQELEVDYPFSVKEPRDNTYGMMLYSKLHLQNSEVRYLIKQEIPSIHTEIEINGFRFKLACLHPEPPTPEEAELSKPRDREFVRMAKMVRDSPGPYVIMGDLNDVGWSDTSRQFEQISRLRDARKGRGFLNTFHANNILMRWALDHIFLSEEFAITELKRAPRIGSDHFPLFIRCGIVRD